MLFHIIETEGRGWDRFVSFLLWAYREVPHDTTGVSPFQMLYGRSPTGPLTVLKQSWTGDIPIPATLREAPAEYLHKLRMQTERAAEEASLTAPARQNAYATQHNKRASPKLFEVSEQVFVFDSACPGKMYSKWIGPCCIRGKFRDHSYYVDMPDGKRKLVHANKLRPYKCRVQGIGVAFQEDDDFGDIECTPRKVRGCQEAQLPYDQTAHLERDAHIVRTVFDRHRQLFSPNTGIAKVGVHRVALDPGYVPKRAYPYRIPETLRGEVERQTDELLETGLIYECESPFAHPVVCVAKKDGSVRLCVDYRQLNSVTTTDAFPMQFPDDLIMRVGRSNFVTLIDLRKGYWQVPLASESQLATASVTHQGQFAWRVMPFGLKNAAATFQRIMNSVLRGHERYVCAYFDDIAVFSVTVDEHAVHLEEVFTALEQVGLSANVEKCQVAKPEIRYLGHVVGSGKHAPYPTKLAAIEGLLVPTTKRELRSALGLCGYYRDYIAIYAEIAKPLTELTGKRVPNRLPWADAADRAFAALKKALRDAVALYTPDPLKPYWLYTDASAIAVGACLAQLGEGGEENPDAFASHRFTPSQMRWSTIEREAFGVIWSLKKFDVWLFGASVTVVSDHNPLTYLTLSVPHGAKITRWALALQRHDVKVVHRKGARHGNADALSSIANECWEPCDTAGARSELGGRTS